MVKEGKLKHKRPNKRTNLTQVIQNRIELDRYVTTIHAWMRQSQRSITLPQIRYVLLNGHHEKKKDVFDKVFCSWNYAIRGKTFDGVDLRVIISFCEQDDLLIITAFEVGKGKS